MARVICRCPSCKGELYISSLQCPDCGMELRNKFQFDEFGRLSDEAYQFLLVFLKYRGNLKQVQEELHISYPTVKKKLDALLVDLGLEGADSYTNGEEDVPDMDTWTTDANSTMASEIIKDKLKKEGGRAVVHTIQGLPCEIRVGSDGVSLLSNKLPTAPAYRFEVFDYIVNLLLKQGGRAKKGNGRNYKLGEEHCDETTVVGYIGKYYSGKFEGDSVFDPVFVLAAVLEWAGIAHNGRGEIVLNKAYQEKIMWGG